MTVLYAEANVGSTELIAASEDERKLEEKMYEWCEKRNITPVYYHGDYRFSKISDDGLGTVNGWLRFETVKII